MTDVDSAVTGHSGVVLGWVLGGDTRFFSGTNRKASSRTNKWCVIKKPGEPLARVGCCSFVLFCFLKEMMSLERLQKGRKRCQGTAKYQGSNPALPASAGRYHPHALTENGRNFLGCCHVPDDAVQSPLCGLSPLILRISFYEIRQ